MTLFTASLGVVVKGKKKKKRKKDKKKKGQKRLKVSTEKPKLLPSSQSTKEDVEGEQMDSLVCISVSSWQPYQLCRLEVL